MRARPTREEQLLALLAGRYSAPDASLVPFYEQRDRAVYRVDRSGGSPWVLRLFEPERPATRTVGDAAVLRYLELHRVPAERLVRAADGSPTVTLGEQSALVTGFVPGGRPDRSPATLRRLGEAVGRLHALRPVPPADLFLTRTAGSEPAQDLAAARAWLDGVAGMVPPAHRAAYDAVAAAVEATRVPADLPRGLTHNDRHLGNAHRTPDGQVVLFDWEGAGQGTLAAALGWLLFSCAVAAPGDPPRRASAELVAPVVEGYCRHRVPTDAELAWLPDAVRIRPLVIAARTLVRSIESGQAPDPRWAWSGGYVDAELVAGRARETIAGLVRRWDRSGRARPREGIEST